MKRWYANLMLRRAFRVFRKYHDLLPKELNGIIWGEMTRKPGQTDYTPCEPGCSMCATEAEEDRERQAQMQKWLSGKR